MGRNPDDTTIRSARKRWGRLSLLAGSRGGAVAVQFLVQLLVGSSLGAAALGALQLMMTWTCIVGEFLAQGLPTQAMKLVSVADAEGNTVGIRRWLANSGRRILLLWAVFGIATMGVLAIPGKDWTEWMIADYAGLALAVFLAAPCFALLRLYVEAMKARSLVLHSVILESLVPPLALLLTCLLVPSLQIELSTGVLLGIYVLTIAVLVVLSRHAAQANTGVCASGATRAIHGQASERRFFWGSALLSISFVHFPFLVLPLFASVDIVGVFALAFKLINVITTLLLLLAAVFGPAFARAAESGASDNMARLLLRSQLLSTGIYLPCIAILLLSAPLLTDIFPGDFSELQLFMLLLAAGHLVNAATGLPGLLLNMAGQARAEFMTVLFTLLAGLPLTGWLGHAYGAAGVALAFSVMVATKNLASYLLARRLLQGFKKTEPRLLGLETNGVAT